MVVGLGLSYGRCKWFVVWFVVYIVFDDDRWGVNEFFFVFGVVMWGCKECGYI